MVSPSVELTLLPHKPGGGAQAGLEQGASKPCDATTRNNRCASLLPLQMKIKQSPICEA